MDTSERKKSKFGGSSGKHTASRVFWGLFFLIAGVAIVLNQLGLLGFAGLSLGTIIWTVLLLIVFIFGIAHLFWFAIFFPIAGAALLYAEPLGLSADINWWPIFGAALFLSIGFSILFRKKRRWNKDYNWAGNEDGKHSKEHFEKVVNTTDGTSVYEHTSFGSTIKYINSENFEEAALDCSFGALKVYFDNAKIPSGKATISIMVSFGAVELYIPKSWRLIDDMTRSFSGVGEKNRQSGAETAVVTLTGEASFAGIEIIYV
ncbi:MAG: hypothetical protein LBN36_04510 [Clostridiales Family XIII bacterium]|nr:hypothetical protein [Clostridiales Family XIII bacterium]